VVRSGFAKLVRDSVQIWEGEVSSLRRFKDDAKEVAAGYECGIGLEGFNDIKPGDVIEFYVKEEVEATLE
jgi:translation initiation factor IF-2